jgi:hypothetical protein
MRFTRTFFLVWTLWVLGVGIYAADNVFAATDGTVKNSSFEKLKTLVGTWESKTPDGKVATTSIKLTSNGSALMFENKGEEEMITVVHPDGDGLMATHYCGAKNQPRFVAVASSDPSVIAFQFKDITNLQSPKTGHMRGVAFKMVDADHHREDWTWSEDGKEGVHGIDFVRSK